MASNRIKLEICVDTVEGALSAQAGGADRLELCSGLSEGGLTPSIGLIRVVTDACTLPVMVMIRPRGGAFSYTSREKKVMLADVAAAAAGGAAGVVCGALDVNHDVDLPFVRELVAAAESTPDGPLQVTFHRAFDVARCPFDALDAIAEIGVDRILTSGQQPNAVAGRDVLQRLLNEAADRLIIMPGAGLRPDNVAEVVAQTGATEVHGSAAEWVSQTIHEPGAVVSRRRVTSEAIVRHMREALDALG